MLSAFNLGHRDGYAAFLLAQVSAVAAVETALDHAGADQVIDDWARRRRSAALQQDIETLGRRLPASVDAPDLPTPAHVLGAAYVLEGSRLGGAVLIRMVEPGLPTAFLAPGNPGDWRAFVSLLEERLSSEQRLSAAIQSALAVFTLFEQSARLYLGAARS